MKIVHRIIGKTADDAFVALVKRCGLGMVHLSPLMFAVDVTESHECYEAIQAMARHAHLPESVLTDFGSAELAASDYVAFGEPAWINEYPQPEDRSVTGYLKVTYDLTQYCTECGIGAVQVNPFRLKREPKWGKRSIFRLNWVQGEFFVPPSYWDNIFRPLGIRSLPVIDHETDQPLKNVVQLAIDHGVDLDMGDSRLLGVEASRCGTCNRVRYRGWVNRGYFPRPAKEPQCALFRSNQFFGYGSESGNIVYVTHGLYRQIATIKGVAFKASLPTPR